MIKNIGPDIARILSLTGTQDKALLIKPGAIVKAEVIDLLKDGNVLLRLLSQGSGGIQGEIQGAILKAFTEVPLAKGQQVFLEVHGSKNNITMQFIGDVKDPSTQLQPQKNVPVRILDMLAKLSEARLANSEVKQVFEMLKSLPESIKTAIPEFKGLEKLFVDAKQLDGSTLRAFVETSGVAFETKLKIAVMNDPQSLFQKLLAMQSEGDLKGLLLKISSMLKDADVVQALKQKGFKVSEVSDMVEKFTRNIEFYQVTSKVNDMFYTFLPVLWNELREGEFLFRKQKGDRRDSYTCDINLDLARIGKLSVSVTTVDKAFYVSFFVDSPEIAGVISSEKKALEERFASQGLVLKAVNINQRKDIAFGKPQRSGVNVKA